MKISPKTYKTNAPPRHKRIDGEAFQKSIRTSKPKTWLTGENSLKKFPGLTVLKYSFAAAIEFGTSLPQDFASTRSLPFANLENEVPADDWGLLDGGPDFKHFKEAGHRITAAAVLRSFDSVIPKQAGQITAAK